MSNEKENKKSALKKSLIEWSIIGSVIGLLYITGLHTEVLGTMQRAMLWTGFFDADTTEIATTEGAKLSDSDYLFAMQTKDGKTASLSDFRGEVVFINVWASWCPPCVAEMPTIETLYENVAGQPKIRFILLSLDDDRPKAVDFMEDRDFSLPYYFPASALPEAFRSQYLPTTYVLSKEGQIVYKKEGIADYSSPNFARWLMGLAEK